MNLPDEVVSMAADLDRFTPHRKPLPSNIFASIVFTSCHILSLRIFTTSSWVKTLYPPSKIIVPSAMPSIMSSVTPSSLILRVSPSFFIQFSIARSPSSATSLSDLSSARMPHTSSANLLNFFKPFVLILKQAEGPSHINKQSNSE